MSSFWDRAEEVFEEIEAHGQEPQLDEDWIDELTGENDSFYFSTDSLVRELKPLPGRKRGRKPLSDQEVQRLTREIENSIIDDENETTQSFEQALAVAHGENVENWINSIRHALSDSENREIEFWRLQQLTRVRPTELFLGLLLGQEHWTMGQQEFYGQLFVCRRGSGRGREEKGGMNVIFQLQDTKLIGGSGNSQMGRRLDVKLFVLFFNQNQKVTRIERTYWGWVGATELGGSVVSL